MSDLQGGHDGCPLPSIHVGWGPGGQRYFMSTEHSFFFLFYHFMWFALILCELPHKLYRTCTWSQDNVQAGRQQCEQLWEEPVRSCRTHYLQHTPGNSHLATNFNLIATFIVITFRSSKLWNHISCILKGIDIFKMALPIRGGGNPCPNGFCHFLLLNTDYQFVVLP